MHVVIQSQIATIITNVVPAHLDVTQSNEHKVQNDPQICIKKNNNTLICASCRDSSENTFDSLISVKYTRRDQSVQHNSYLSNNYLKYRILVSTLDTQSPKCNQCWQCWLLFLTLWEKVW